MNTNLTALKEVIIEGSKYFQKTKIILNTDDFIMSMSDQQKEYYRKNNSSIIHCRLGYSPIQCNGLLFHSKSFIKESPVDNLFIGDNKKTYFYPLQKTTNLHL